MSSRPVILPNNTEAEQALLGILLFDPARFADIEGQLSALDFYLPVHQLLYQVVAGLAPKGELTLPAAHGRMQAQDAERYQGMGGWDYLYRLTEAAPMGTGAAQMAALIRDAALRRRIVQAAEHLRAAACGDQPVDQVISGGEWALRDIATGAGTGEVWHDGRALCDVVSDKLAGRRKGSYITTGYDSLDHVMGGIRRGRLTILAGRPSMGKSAVGLEIGRHVAAAGHGVGFFSLEMDDEELALRMACAQAFQPGGEFGPIYFDMQRDRPRTDDIPLLERGALALRDLPFHFDDRTGLTPGQIVPAARRLIRKWDKAKIRPGVLIVDHLHLVRSETDWRGNRAAEIGEVSGALRDLARDTGVAVLALCQLNREVEGRGNKDKRPQLSDLKWSGNIEEDANTIVFLFRPEYYLQEPEDKDNDKAMMDYMEQKMKWAGKIQFLTRKNRGGPNMTDHTMRISLAHNALWEG